MGIEKTKNEWEQRKWKTKGIEKMENEVNEREQRKWKTKRTKENRENGKLKRNQEPPS